MSLSQRRAIIDIGSNTIRLVVFGGPRRVPLVLYNEKLTAGLGRGVVASGQLDAKSVQEALRGLARFKALVEAMPLESLDVVATAAVRDASNGAAFLESARALGLPARLLSGEEEAVASGLGVISAHPDADGLVADLGGGSLELVHVRQGAVLERVSLPLGILKVQDLRRAGEQAFADAIQALVQQVPWLSQCRGLPFYMVGGSWRSLARLHMHLSQHPLQILGGYAIAPAEVAAFRAQVDAMTREEMRRIASLPAARVPLVHDAAALLEAVTTALAPSELITCAFGLREGLLFEKLKSAERAKDPLIEGIRFATDPYQQFLGYDAALNQWLDPLFGHEPADAQRLRQAVCLLRGTGWASNPEFRALSGEEMALHGNWVGITARERAIMGVALFVGLGGGGEEPPILAQLASADDLARGRGWGHAIRLAQRLSGGAPSLLEQTRLSRSGDQLQLTLPPALAHLSDASVERRLARLATALGALGSAITLPD